MSQIFKAVFFCCAATDETKEEIEKVENQEHEKKVNEKTVVVKEEKTFPKSYSEERNEIHIRVDSSESNSISSGSNN
jgi:hypothetical protein